MGQPRDARCPPSEPNGQTGSNSAVTAWPLASNLKLTRCKIGQTVLMCTNPKFAKLAISQIGQTKARTKSNQHKEGKVALPRCDNEQASKRGKSLPFLDMCQVHALLAQTVVDSAGVLINSIASVGGGGRFAQRWKRGTFALTLFPPTGVALWLTSPSLAKDALVRSSPSKVGRRSCRQRRLLGIPPGRRQMIGRPQRLASSSRALVSPA